jgi:NAD+ kinase
MKRIHLVGKDLERVERMKESLKDLGFDYVEENPDLVISYGGDGMFLIAERLFPGVPKICMKDSEVGKKCCDFDLEEVLKKYSLGDFEIGEIRKLKAIYRGRFETRELIGVNDIVVRNSLPTEAVRFNVRVVDEKIEGIIGDGVVISTAYGSDGYFSSITGKSFDEGIGLAFNNVTKFHRPLILSGKEKIEIEIIRGPAVLVADNNRDYINLNNGDKIMIEQIDEVAKRIVFNGDKN